MPCIHPTECSIDIYTVNVKRLNFFMLLIVWFKYQHMTQYNTSTQQVNIYDETSLVNSVAPNLWEVDQCFGPQTYQRLRNIIDVEENLFSCGGLKKRLELVYPSEDYLFINEVGSAMSDAISTIVGHQVSFMTAKYWIDLPTFGCQTHADAKEIFVSYQVYLNSALRNEIRSKPHMPTTAKIVEYLDTTNGEALMAQGAKFLHVDPPTQIKFKPNNGYINLNSDLKPHQVIGSWDTRTSVMFQYSRV